MDQLRKLLAIKFIALFVAMLLFVGDISLFAQQSSDYAVHFKKAKEDYQAGEYQKVINRIERQLDYISEESKDFSSKVYLLMGAAYEKLGKIGEARKKYILVRQLSKIKAIEGMDFNSLIEYRSIILKVKTKKVIEKVGKKSKKKKFPIALVLIGVAAIVAVVLLLGGKTPTNQTAKDVYDSIQWQSVPSGNYEMGSNEYKDERPIHTVYLDSYSMSKYEVTHALFIKFLNDVKASSNGSYGGNEVIDMDDSDCAIGHNGSFYFKGSSYASTDNTPVIEVTWYGAKEFCDWLSAGTGQKISLPTEAEWEKAARGTDQRKYPWGNSSPNSSRCNYNSNVSKTQPVGSYPSGVSPYGIYDMAGNVWEWCSDWYGSSYYSSSPSNNPTGPSSGSYRVHRGGSWNGNAICILSSNRNSNAPSPSNYNVGFRLSRH